MNFYYKQCLPVITWNKKHLWKQVVTKKKKKKQVVTVTYTLEKIFFAAVTFESLKKRLSLYLQIE